MTMRVLYIEDEPEMLELVQLILKRNRLEFHGANGGRTGLAAVSEIGPDLILLDLMMPDMDGWDVYAQLKQHPAWQHIPVLIVTARTQSDERLGQVRAAANADDYIIKPFGPSQLIEGIERVAARARINS